MAEATRLLHLAVGFDGWCLLTMDPATLLPTYRFKDDAFGPEDSARLATNEYLQDDVNKFVELARTPHPVGVLSQATGDSPHRSARYRELLQPAGYGPELRAAFCHQGSCWGVLQLFRNAGAPDFTPTEADFLASISVGMAEGIRRALLLSEAETNQASDAPGLVLLDAGDEVESTTAAAERWLEELRTLADGAALLPAIVYALAGRARAGVRSPGDASNAPPRARVRARSGTWLVLYGSLLEAAPPGRVAVIIEPARPAEIAPLVARAYGLSTSEWRVARAVMAGRSTEEIARTLHLSTYTVQDHLKGIFDKVGVRSRRELVAQVFFQQYLPRLAAAAPPSSAGSFRE